MIGIRRRDKGEDEGCITPQEIRQIGRKVRRKYNEDCGIYGYCNQISGEVIEEIKDKEGCGATIIWGFIGKEPHLSTKHAWIYMRSSQVKGIDEGPVFIDPTIDQFRSSNVEDKYIDVDLGENLPEVAIVTPNNEKWEWYM